MPLTVSTDIQPALRSSESAPKNFGSRLMARREGLGLSVSDMADATNIRIEYITAIEGLNEAALPAIGYTLGYVRTYAQALGMDGDIAVKDFKADAALSRLPMRDAPHVIFRRHWRLPRGFLSALTVASAALMIGVWYGTQSEAVATPVPMVEIAPQYTALAPAAPVLKTGLYTLHATAPSWIEIRNGLGHVEVSRIFVTDETWQGQTGAGYSVSIRDAGAVELYDGETLIGALGPLGEPLSGLPLSEAAFIPEAPTPDTVFVAALPETQ